MSSVLKILHTNTFSFSAELIPPRNGSDFDSIFSQIDLLAKNNFHFVSVTHGAGGSLRGGTLPICHFAQEKNNLSSIAHLTCRSSKEELENSLIDHHYFNINNILALRGDPPDGFDTEFKPAPGGFRYAYQLIQQISNMNKGLYLVRKNFDKDAEYREGKPTSFCIGAACYPEEDPNLEYLQLKRQCGAHFAISQMIYDINLLKIFYNKITNLFGHDFPIIPGIRIPSSYKQLLHVKTKFGITVPDSLLHALEKASTISDEEMEKVGLEWMIHFVEGIQKIGYKGVHLFIMNKPKLAIDLKNGFMKSIL